MSAAGRSAASGPATAAAAANRQRCPLRLHPSPPTLCVQAWCCRCWRRCWWLLVCTACWPRPRPPRPLRPLPQRRQRRPNRPRRWGPRCEAAAAWWLDRLPLAQKPALRCHPAQGGPAPLARGPSPHRSSCGACWCACCIQALRTVECSVQQHGIACNKYTVTVVTIALLLLLTKRRMSLRRARRPRQRSSLQMRATALQPVYAWAHPRPCWGPHPSTGGCACSCRQLLGMRLPAPEVRRCCCRWSVSQCQPLHTPHPIPASQQALRRPQGQGSSARGHRRQGGAVHAGEQTRAAGTAGNE